MKLIKEIYDIAMKHALLGEKSEFRYDDKYFLIFETDMLTVHKFDGFYFSGKVVHGWTSKTLNEINRELENQHWTIVS